MGFAAFSPHQPNTISKPSVFLPAKTNLPSPLHSEMPSSFPFLSDVSSGLASLLHMRGGGGGAAGGASVTERAFDLTRARIRIEGLQMYGVLTALMMNAALRIYSSTPRKIKDVVVDKGDSANNDDVDDKKSTMIRVENIATYMFCALVALSIISGAYTSVLFTLLGLYSKTALGAGHDDRFVEFFERTAAFRRLGFNSFLASLMSFTGSFIISVFLSTHGQLRWMVSLPATALAIAACFNLKGVMDLATVIIFQDLKQ